MLRYQQIENAVYCARFLRPRLVALANSARDKRSGETCQTRRNVSKEMLRPDGFNKNLGATFEFR